ncbi:MAG: diketogulonate reductase-like aldo/keto reductase [Polyangiales bacterium]|jgi:diketogulonate reductase-like aldo/keto reductase
MTLSLQSTRTLHDGREFPTLGLGVWQSRGGDEVNAVRWALEAGYRHIDTAAIYQNEEGVGQALRESKVPREEIWVTTKLWNDDIRQGKAREGLQTSLEKLGLDYVDLYLLHWPVDGRIAAWNELEKMRDEGLCRSIGVSNFMTEHMDELMKNGAKPVVNQVELHPYLQQRDVVTQCESLDIAVQGWSPLIQGKFKDEPLFAEIGKKHERSAAQVAIRWGLQKGFVTIPKSTNEGRIRANADVFEFELEDVDMVSIDALERGERFADPRNITF